MPAPQPSLDHASVRGLIDAHLHAPVGLDAQGLELEWLTSDPGDRSRRPVLSELEELVRAAGELPAGGRITVEPGGQVELATVPHHTIDALCEAAADDLHRLDGAARSHGLELVALGADPTRPPERVSTAPRYAAMEQHLDRRGAAGRTMMCNTASIQLNVGRGPDDDEARRWQLANRLVPCLIAAFANSPFDTSGPSGWVSTRMRAWSQMDATRAGPVPTDGDVVEDWLRYALAADVVLVRRSPGDVVAVRGSLPFGRWLAEGHETGFPTDDDLHYHLTTLFPPVRPRGWLELRMFDALPTPFWHVAVAVTTALLDDAVGPEVVAALDGTDGLWVEAAQLGLGHPSLRRSTGRCFEIAREALAEQGADGGIQAVVATYDERWVQRGRCPADDLLDRWQATGDPYPLATSPVPFHDLEASVS